MRIPRALRAVWGAGLILLNVLDERAFMWLFVVVAVAVLLSFAYIALSIMHALFWSDLSNDRMFVWATPLFAGGDHGVTGTRYR